MDQKPFHLEGTGQLVVGCFGPKGHGKSWIAGSLMFHGGAMPQRLKDRYEEEALGLGRPREDGFTFMFDREKIVRETTGRNSAGVYLFDHGTIYGHMNSLRDNYSDTGPPSLVFADCPGNLKYIANIAANLRYENLIFFLFLLVKPTLLLIFAWAFSFFPVPGGKPD